MPEGSNNSKTLKITVSEAAATNLDFEAMLAGKSVNELVRMGLTLAIAYHGVLRQIQAHMPDADEKIDYYVNITAEQAGRAKDFSIQIDPDTMQVSFIPGEEYDI